MGLGAGCRCLSWGLRSVSDIERQGSEIRVGRPSGGSFLPRCCSSARARSSAAWGTKCAFNSSQNLRSLCRIARLACFLSFGSGSIPKKRKLVPAVPRAPGSTLNSSCVSVPQCSHLYLAPRAVAILCGLFWSDRRPEGSSKHSFSRDRKRNSFGDRAGCYAICEFRCNQDLGSELTNRRL